MAYLISILRIRSSATIDNYSVVLIIPILKFCSSMIDVMRIPVR